MYEKFFSLMYTVSGEHADDRGNDDTNSLKAFDMRWTKDLLYKLLFSGNMHVLFPLLQMRCDTYSIFTSNEESGEISYRLSEFGQLASVSTYLT